MKKKIFVIAGLGLFLLNSCGNSNSDALNQVMETKDDFEEAALSFEEGGATNGEEYFFGVQAEVVDIDVKLREIETMDEEDATESEFNSHFDEMLSMIEECRKALDLYSDETWPKRQQLHDLTLEWVAGVEGLINNHLVNIAAALGTPDEDWSDADFDSYDEYLTAYDEYLEIDNRWVDFQYEFAAANGFQLSDETIDMDALIEEDLESKNH